MDAFMNDPIVTGERSGIGWGVLNLVGGLIAIPFQLLDFGVQQLDKVAKIAEEKDARLAAEAALSAPAPVAVLEAPAPVAEAVAAAPVIAAPKAAPAAEAAPAAGGKAKFDKAAMLAKIREKKAQKG
jgi:hypothetical protein